jgi:2-polyprenyl-3-methyl-5-hydroxy-6-metoxy-1,4-benzoquinol methylase
MSVYDLSPERVGRFDVVVCGSLLLHMRDPARALEAGHRRMLRSGGFHVERTTRPYRIPFGAGHPRRGLRPSRRGVAHSAALARPAT